MRKCSFSRDARDNFSFKIKTEILLNMLPILCFYHSKVFIFMALGQGAIFLF